MCGEGGAKMPASYKKQYKEAMAKGITIQQCFRQNRKHGKIHTRRIPIDEKGNYDIYVWRTENEV